MNILALMCTRRKHRSASCLHPDRGAKLIERRVRTLAERFGEALGERP
jgi:hypothetical protein